MDNRKKQKILVSEKNYEKEIIESSQLILLEFFAPWCPKCAMMEDVVEEVFEEYDGSLKVCQINIEESKTLAEQFEVEIVPVFFVVQSGTILASVVGNVSKQTLKQMIELQ
ncbi:MAG: thioredoxin family protein [Candidatus Ruminococcus intestinipullorum]|nr:thioredoxin family protein [Candidatus Ruminococcus intestinipullorum]